MRRGKLNVVVGAICALVLFAVLATPRSSRADSVRANPGISAPRGAARTHGSFATLAGHRPVVVASFEMSGREQVVKGTVGRGIRGGGLPSQWRALVEQQVGAPGRRAKWFVRASGVLTAAGGSRAFSVRWHVPVSARRLLMRVVIIARGRTLAVSAPRHVHVPPAVTVHSALRRSAVKPPAGSVERVSGAPSGEQTIVLAHGTRTPAVGGALVLAPSRAAPQGVLGLVKSAHTLPDGLVSLTTTPATLDQAYSAFDASVSGELGELEEAARATDAGARSARATAASVKPTFKCSDPSTDRSVTTTVDLSHLHLVASVTGQPSIDILLTGSPRFELGIQFSGKVTCKAAASVPIPLADSGIIVELGPDFTFTASGAVGANFTWEPHLTYGFFRSRYSGNSDTHVFRNGGSVSFTGQASLKLALDLDAAVTLAGRVGIEGSIGPEITGTVTAHSATQNTCLTVDGDVAANLTAFADIFFHKWSFDLASVTFGDTKLFEACTNPVAPPPPTPPPPPPAVPAAGPTLVFDAVNDLSAQDYEDGDATYENFAKATGQPAEVTDELPSDIDRYRCTMLLDNVDLSEAQKVVIQGYLNAGGTVLAVGDWGPGYDAGDEAMNQLAEGLGVSMFFQEDLYDEGFNVTTNILASPFTQGVASIGDGAVTGLDVSAPAQALAYDSTNSVPFIGEQAVDGGTVVMIGDTDVFDDRSSANYEFDDNGQFARNLCP
jgi:hypothetical protein